MHHLLQLSCVALLAFVLLTNNIVQSAPSNGPDDDDSSEILYARGILSDFKQWVTDLFHKIGLTKREQREVLDHMIRTLERESKRNEPVSAESNEFAEQEYERRQPFDVNKRQVA